MNSLTLPTSSHYTHPIILAIDTSCDDTSVAVTHGHTILANIIASQTELHTKYGGVFPTVAKQAHAEHLPQAVMLALKRAKLQWNNIAAIAITAGPGLAPALEVGIAYAKQLATQHEKRLIEVNHIEGHILSVLAEPLRKTTLPLVRPHFPAISVIVSGGHTQFVLVTKYGKYQVLGKTVDDSAGECLDKIGRMLSLGYPAGPVIEHYAKQGDKHRFKFPLPMTQSRSYDMSFSGLKTHARNMLDKLDYSHTFDMQDNIDFCASTQFGVFRAIMYKLHAVLKDHPQIEEVWLGGGVAANTELRRMVRQTARHARGTPMPVRVPYSKKLCVDNAGMIGIVAHHKALTNEYSTPESIERKPKWSVETTPRPRTP